jgi:SAM-dependent methyltransferase
VLWLEEEYWTVNDMKADHSQYVVTLKLSSWLRELLVDPISKRAFIEHNESGFRAPCGFIYRYRNGVPDFRVRLKIGARKWLAAQRAFESRVNEYFSTGEADPMFYKREQDRDRPIYETLSLSGRVLDVGGLLGHIRKYMELDQEYCSVDPFIGVHLLASGRKNLFASYPLSSPLNLIGGFAEFLPFRDACFDTVNMRSCIDHLFNPEFALLEAYRVLRKDGKLIIGISLENGSFRAKVKEIMRPAIAFFYRRYKEQHVWHFTYEEVIDLCKFCGFELAEEVWQEDNILYACFMPQEECVVTTD